MHRSVRGWCLLALVLVGGAVSGTIGGTVWAQPVTHNWDALLEPMLRSHAGRVSVAFKHLGTQETYAYQADQPMPTASLIKLPIMVEAYRQVEAGTLDLQRMVTLRSEDQVPGSGVLSRHFSPGLSLSVHDLIHLMIAFSDNTATNLLLDQIGLSSTSATMEKWGFAETKLHSYVYRRETSIFPDRSQRFGLGSTTAAEMVRLLEQLQRGELVSAQASQAMLEHLRQCDDRSKMARFLDPQVKVAHKTGAVSTTRCDAGIVEGAHGALVLCILTTDNEDQSDSESNAAEVLCGQIARVIYEQLEPEVRAEHGGPITLQLGSSGAWVSDLQRTLNVRVTPSPELQVDGEFGPATEAAVRQFQTAQGLPVDGIVDAAVWSQLGAVVPAGTPVPDPATVNAEVLPLEPADTSDGPPVVTARAWAIADAATGQLLWGDNQDAARDPASTTKIMTAYATLRAAARFPGLLDEMALISPLADQTIGSSGDLRAGEKLAVRELLYALLLPSGNDAAVALAEHVGEKLASEAHPVLGPPLPPLQRFVVEMNRLARDLGLHQTHFANPHGLTDPTHKTSAADLVLLSRHAWQDAMFRDLVATRQHGCRLEGPAGQVRHVVWKNTNRLLARQGYWGIKTGTTDAAGCCLAAGATQGERQLLAVVLGSSSSEARYADTRNLFRWAFAQPLPAPPLPSEADPTRLPPMPPPVQVTDDAWDLHRSALVWDGHNDLPWELRQRATGSFDKFDLAQHHPELHTDLPRLQLGGVRAQFWSVYVPADTAYDGSALTKTLEQIELVRAMNTRYANFMELARTADDVERIVAQGKLASLIGVEGGHSIEDSLSVLRKLYELGARYMTLTHSDTLRWADSATDEPQHQGLTPFGEEVVREMNRLGMLVDLSHVSEECMSDALRVSTAPVIFSHSSARTLADHPRNVPDAILQQTAQNGGVVMVNFFSAYVMPAAAQNYANKNALERQLKEKYGADQAAIDREMQAWRAAHPLEPGTIHAVVDHIEHIVHVAGIDHVGLGSDYDGVTVLPHQLEDVSTYPRITQELLNRGYSPDDIRKVLGQNMLRVLRAAEQEAARLRAKP